ncbi:V-type ATP synthase subunit I [Enterococcus sp. 669A]|uniref:V-type ATP synthase subunit I n=1 Tax=Candidatus Enterococcus moelleringii TaxID=2815325 RepID=A0ABS3LBU5_9ENTE|nr:V-type ATP synthase subunit I [Enterococcus sp. 669A]MBO1307108.1 V-type ATP synthase subunit I [Enterococcus sp. 669A]
MGVTKMKKVTIISERSYQDSLLQAIQGLQNVEVRDLSQSVENNDWVQQYFSTAFEDVKEADVSELHLLQTQINELVQFIQHHGKNKDKIKGLKRRYISLQEIEKNFDQQQLRQELMEITDLKQRWEEAQQRQEQLLQEETWLTRWQYLDVAPTQVQSMSTELLIAEVSTQAAAELIEELKQLELVHYEEVYSDDSSVSFALVFLNELKATVQDLLTNYSAEIAKYPYEVVPRTALQQVKEQLKTLHKEGQKLSKQIGKKKLVIGELQWAEEVLLAMEEREKLKNQFVQSAFLVVLQGWISEDEVNLMVSELAELFGQDTIYLDFEDPTAYEEENEVPTKLKNNALVEPFEMLTEMYALPHYKEVDPTPWMMPFYLVFFGMMVADLGYGLLMLIATTVALKFLVLPTGMLKFVKFFQILSVPSMVWGLIYNSCFGASLPIPTLLSTQDDVIQILILSVIFGLIQILVGLFIAAKEHIKKKEYLSAVGNGFAWQGILIGLGLMVVGSMLLDNAALSTAGKVLAIVSALSVIVVPIIQADSKLTGFAKGAYDLYGVTGYIGDLVSYTRLMALGISGGSIAAAFNMLVGYMPPAARFTVGILLLIALQGLNIFLTLLSAYVHGARLQYVEFFGKFYSGGGRKFTPLKTAEKYFTIEKKKK